MRTAVDTTTEVTVIEQPSRRHRSKQERRRIAEESLQAGTSAAIVARQHGVNANQVFQWRKLLRDGRLNVNSATRQLLPVRIAAVVEDQSEPQQNGVIQIEFGRIRVRVEGVADPATLRTVLEQLNR
ncbi:MAG TPA: transposase [Bryobacteraceae bacterium]|jgi:transposase|nr:transposase [Bryobacteraceae bacterium]